MLWTLLAKVSYIIQFSSTNRGVLFVKNWQIRVSARGDLMLPHEFGFEGKKDEHVQLLEWLLACHSFPYMIETQTMGKCFKITGCSYAALVQVVCLSEVAVGEMELAGRVRFYLLLW